MELKTIFKQSTNKKKTENKVKKEKEDQLTEYHHRKLDSLRIQL
jgi:hypothetical protein